MLNSLYLIPSFYFLNFPIEPVRFRNSHMTIFSVTSEPRAVKLLSSGSTVVPWAYILSLYRIDENSLLIVLFYIRLIFHNKFF